MLLSERDGLDNDDDGLDAVSVVSITLLSAKFVIVSCIRQLPFSNVVAVGSVGGVIVVSVAVRGTEDVIVARVKEDGVIVRAEKLMAAEADEDAVAVNVQDGDGGIVRADNVVVAGAEEDGVIVRVKKLMAAEVDEDAVKNLLTVLSSRGGRLGVLDGGLGSTWPAAAEDKEMDKRAEEAHSD